MQFRLNLLIFLFSTLAFATPAKFVAVIPQPQVFEMLPSDFDLAPGEIGVRCAGVDSSGCEVSLTDLVDAFADVPGIRLVTDQKLPREIRLGWPERDAAFAQVCRHNKIWPLPDSAGNEAYSLLIQKKQIFLAARTTLGLFYGVQSLKQIFHGRTNAAALPGVKILDWPQFAHRGLLDDISRGPVPTLTFFKQQIRRCAELKFNFISYYTEHVIATEKHGDFAPAGGALTLSEWRELVDFARTYFVEIVPNFQSFGHFEKILAHPQYAPLGEADRLLSPARPASYDLLRDIFSEMAPVFDSPYFNINCDETWDLGRGASKKMVDSLGVAEVYLRHILKLHEMLKNLGKQVWLWGDIAQANPELLARFPKDLIFLPWNYSALDSFRFMTRPFRQAGFQFLVCPGILNSNRIAPDFKMTRHNIQSFIAAGKADHALGVMTTVWDDGGSALFSRDWYGVAFAADQSWHPGLRPDTDFDRRFDSAIYGDLKHGVSTSLRILEALSDLATTQEMNEKIFWSALVPEWNARLRLDFGEWPEILAICDSAARALDFAAPHFSPDDLAGLRLTISQYRCAGLARKWLLEAAASYQQACRTQAQNRSEAREAIVAALNQITRTRQLLSQLKIDFQTNWLRENRAYWLPNLLNRFQQPIDELVDVETRLSQALTDFEKGHFLPPPTEVRLAIEAMSGQYFQSWLLLGPFPNSGTPAPDFLTSVGGEARARGRVALQFDLSGLGTFRWKKYTSPEADAVNLKQVFEKNERVVAYAYCRIESPLAQKVRATFGSNDGIEIIFNGEHLFQRHTKRNLQPDEDEVSLPFNPGENHLLLKIDQGKGDWGFSFRLPDVVLRNHDYKYRILP